MQFKHILSGFIFITWMNGQVTVSASVDVNHIQLNETVGYKITVMNADGTPSVDISPVLKNFNLISGPAQQTNIQWINGKMTSSRTLSWTLTPKKSGKLPLPKIQVRLGNNIYETNAVIIQVDKGGGKSQLSNVFIHLEADKEQAFPGEQVTVTYKLFTKVNLSIEDIRYPKSVGFWTEDLRVNQNISFRDVRIQGIQYKVATLYKAALFPTKSGKLPVEPMIVVANIEVNRKRRSPFGFDDPFFDSMFRETQKQYIRSDSIAIQVDPFPQRQPADFTGAVGQFILSTTLDTNDVKMNQAVSFTVTLEGTGNLNLFNLNDIEFPNNMEVFPPTSTFEKNELRDKLTGKITWEYILIPRASGLYRIPKVELSYFSPQEKSWKSVGTQPIMLKVREDNSSVIATAKFSKKEIELLGKDIHYIRTEYPNWKSKGIRPIPLWVWSSYFIAAVLYLLPGFLIKQKKEYMASSDIRKSKSAFKNSIKQIKSKETDSFSKIAQVIYTYLRERLFLRTQNLDARLVEKELTNTLSDSILRELVAIIKRCDAGQFAPGSAGDIQSVREQVIFLLGKIEKELT